MVCKCCKWNKNIIIIRYYWRCAPCLKQLLEFLLKPLQTINVTGLKHQRFVLVFYLNLLFASVFRIAYFFIFFCTSLLVRFRFRFFKCFWSVTDFDCNTFQFHSWFFQVHQQIMSSFLWNNFLQLQNRC